jgi:putative ABC transport system ATP-binding protein
MNAVTLESVGKTYRMDAVGVAALADIDLQIRRARRDGHLRCVGQRQDHAAEPGRLHRPARQRPHRRRRPGRRRRCDDDALSDFRARHIGFVFQNFNLLPVLTATKTSSTRWCSPACRGARRAAGRRAARTRSGLADKARHGRASSRAGSASGRDRARAGGLAAASCSPTSRPPTSTAAPAPRSSR